MSHSSLYLANRLFSMGWNLPSISNHLELNADELDEVAFFLCDKHGIDVVFPKKSSRKRELAA